MIDLQRQYADQLAQVRWEDEQMTGMGEPTYEELHEWRAEITDRAVDHAPDQGGTPCPAGRTNRFPHNGVPAPGPLASLPPVGAGTPTSPTPE